MDRFSSARMIAYVGIPIALGFLVLGAIQGLFGAAVGLALIAVGHGANATLPNAFWAEFYGTRHIGGIKSLATAVMVLGSALGPGITGRLIDLGIPFEQQMTWIAISFLATSVLVAVGVTRARRLLSPP